jgi:hypothetical protein
MQHSNTGAQIVHPGSNVPVTIGPYELADVALQKEASELPKPKDVFFFFFFGTFASVLVPLTSVRVARDHTSPNSRENDSRMQTHQRSSNQTEIRLIGDCDD